MRSGPLTASASTSSTCQAMLLQPLTFIAATAPLARIDVHFKKGQGGHVSRRVSILKRRFNALRRVLERNRHSLGQDAELIFELVDNVELQASRNVATVLKKE